MENEDIRAKLDKQIARLERLKEEIGSGVNGASLASYDQNRGQYLGGTIDSKTIETYDIEYERLKNVLKKSGFGLNNRRSEMEIIATILEIARRGVNKTNILYKANLSYVQLKNYVGFLLEKGLLENIGRKYSTTQKGRLFLITWQNTLILLD